MKTRLKALRSVSFFIASSVLALALGVAQAQAEQIKLGFIGPLSGGNAQQGLGARNGFLLAVEQANAAGYPYEVEAVVLDDASDPSVGVSAAQKLVNDPAVVGATGHWNSPVALATMPVFNRAQMPFIIWGAVSPKITEQNLPNVTRVTPTLVNENKPLAEAIIKDGKVKKIAIISDTTDYGVANTKWFTEFFTAAGGEIVSSDAAAVGTTDFRAMLTTAKAAAPDAVYFGGVVTEAALVRSQMADLGMGGLPMYGISGIFDPKFIEIAGAAAEGTIVGTPSVQSNPKLEAFEKAYEAKGFAEPAGSYAKYAYEAAQILLTVIKEHGIEDKGALSEAIRNIHHDGILGNISFDEAGQIDMAVEIDLHVVRDGKWVDM
ncbi:branched chain amino acid ABC transporter substrate-binding protein [Paramesorhizobium deserti]|uniref:Branched chain amino acid ABC transporter substrate-binding protein n=1 Tax=Paramesorhizobium deserti TaxID=1494590 RepID=A0A135HNF0_9HYPH|nr:branched-chain amino acid ABC transporter substrate-binding protein [Paramesorhizobium deserti]KXF74690.1 branched chain amino acid ABC transporter substrate-binding protein [Paramesorhizobium deserti]